MTSPNHEVEPVRAAFEKWLMDVHGLDSVWNELRNCFDDFPAHLAFKAWQQAREQAIRECAEIAISEPLLLTPAHGPRPQKRIHDKILKLLQTGE